MQIIDCFIFYNEINLLKYRLSLLYNIVDYFIIVESNYTFVGTKKESFFTTNKDLFEQYQNKIIHILLDTIPCQNPNINNNEQWINERFQRNSIKDGLDKFITDLKDKFIHSS